MKNLVILGIIGICVALVPVTGNTASITVDEIIYATPVTAGDLSGTVDMSWDDVSNVLTIVLTNTSTGTPSTESANIILSGIGFNLQSGVDIASGSVDTGGSTLVNFPGSFSGTDVSGEYGYDNNPLASGPFLPAPAGITRLSVDTVVSVMQAATDTKFSNNDIDGSNLNGPDFGLISAETDLNVFGNGQEAILDSVVVTLYLNGGDANLLNFIEAGDVVLSFGSPNAVPEPSTLLLLGSGLVGLGILRRKFVG